MYVNPYRTKPSLINFPFLIPSPPSESLARVRLEQRINKSALLHVGNSTGRSERTDAPCRMCANARRRNLKTGIIEGTHLKVHLVQARRIEFSYRNIDTVFRARPKRTSKTRRYFYTKIRSSTLGSAPTSKSANTEIHGANHASHTRMHAAAAAARTAAAACMHACVAACVIDTVYLCIYADGGIVPGARSIKN
jgi:hypothetical protein